MVRFFCPFELYGNYIKTGLYKNCMSIKKNIPVLRKKAHSRTWGGGTKNTTVENRELSHAVEKSDIPNKKKGQIFYVNVFVF